MLKTAWTIASKTVSAFMADDALSRGAAIAFYTITSLAPILAIIIGIAGLAFGHEAARGAIVSELGGMMGPKSADMLQTALASSSNKSAGILATVLGGLTLLLTASGVFGEMQTALNVIWKAKPEGAALTTLVKARAASLGLVMTLGFLLMVSLVASAGITALSGFIDAYIPFGRVILTAVNFLISFSLISVLFAAIYKILPDKKLEWRDVIVGAVATSLLFTVGKTLIGLYLGSSTVASSYGAAGGLMIALLWVYYSSEIFLLGAEFTKVYAVLYGSHAGSTVADPQHVSRQGPQPPTQAARPFRPLTWQTGLGALVLLGASWRRPVLRHAPVTRSHKR